MFGPVAEAWQWLVSHVPTAFKQPKLNFITIHYLYMIGMTIIGSILLYPAGGLRYIDALFFAAGATTQSGLNTIDVNQLFLYQQIVLGLIACIANPVFINSFVVFVRLYWFEKRFQHIVSEARKARQTRSRSRSVSEMEADEALSRVERGVAGREIKVLHETTVPNGMSGGKAQGPKGDMDEKAALQHLAQSVPETPPEGSNKTGDGSSTDTVEKIPEPNHLGMPLGLRRDITFADEVHPNERRLESPGLAPIPGPRSAEHHIAFLEKQRRAKEQGTLRIPGPRDFDRGDVPRELDSSDEEGGALTQSQTRATLPDRRPSSANGGEHDDDHPIKRGITIDEPERQSRGMQGRSATADSFGVGKLADKQNQPEGDGLRNRILNKTMSTLVQTKSRIDEPMPYLSWQATIGRNSMFVDLTADQREELGGIEYRALKTLAVVLVCYFVGFHLLGIITLTPWIVRSGTWGPIVDASGVSRAWWGIFTAPSMFNDLGFTLTPDSMISFQQAILPLLFGSFLIVIGNTGFPCMLRFVIWVASKLVPHGSGVWEELRFLLDHPRRCFTLMFPGKATWWLFWILVGLNGLDLVFFIVLDLHDTVVTSLPPGFRVLDGWFQAVSTRTAGFAVVNLADLHPAIQVSYLIMMYISVFPIAISVRRTNVYEEKSLGIWGGEEEEGEEGDKSYVATHLRRQLSFDLWFVFLGFFIIAIVEGPRLQNTNDYAFTMFSVLFEIISAYGTVGLSLGYPNINASFSAEFATLSKLVIVAMMLRGRHRGLPYALDRAILLPSENLHKGEQEEAERRKRRNSFAPAPEDAAAAAAEHNRIELDDEGLPRQHTFVHGGGRIVPTAGAQQRRGSTMSARTAKGGYANLGRVLTGALSAGPTYGRKFD
ncbi:low affinity potassium transporter [Elasticomyces elasticus]|nr:low affinity potassium transporter [Elasticomyces elasticus]